jgi:hypothetical protein
LAAGQQQQQTQQAGLQALYNQFQQQQGFPYQQAQFLANIATGTGALSGNASSGTSTTTGGGGFFSDERLKENIQRVGETDDGQPIYRYNYKGDKNTQIGLLAQDVEKHHPEAVGLAGGYKTVNYKKATEDAIHKEDGGALSGTDAYSIGAPSAMLRENSGKGLGAMPSLPQAFMGGRDIPIEAGASGAGLAALRAPQATGYSLGTREGKEAELASLQSSLLQPPGPNGDLLGSGPQYLQSRIGTLQDWLNKNNSQGGLVSGPGNFARGGLAEGDYMNPALAYYSPQQAQQGVFQLQPMPQRQILQGQQMQAPQQRQQADPFGDATKIAGLVGGGKKAYDWIKEKTKDSPAYDNEWTPGEENDADTLIDLNTPVAARGGLIAGRHHYSRGGINPYGGLGGGNDILGPIIEEQDTSRRLSNDKVTPPPAPKQQSGGLGDLMKAKSIYDMGDKAYKGGEWAAGKLGLTGPETAMSATSTEALPGVSSGIAAAPVAEVVPGVASGIVPEAIAPVIPEALTASTTAAPLFASGLDAAGMAGGLAGAGETAALLGGAEAATAATAAAEIPWYLLLLKDGGAVPRRHHFEDGGFESGTSQILPADPAFDPNFDEPKTLRGAPVVRRGVAPLPETTAVAATPRTTEAPVTLGDAVEPARAAAPPKPSKSFLPEITSEGVRDTLSSENFWVPALAGLGSMLASPNKTLAGAIGSGLVGGTGAYTELQKQQSEIAKNSLDIFNKVFEKRVDDEGNISYMNLQTGKPASPQEAFGFLRTMPGFSNLAGASASGKEKPRDATVELAKNVVQGGTEAQAPRSITPPAQAASTTAVPSTAAAPPAAAVETAKPVAPPAATATTTTAAEGEPSIARVPDAAKAEIFRIDQELRAHPEVAAELDQAKKQAAIAARAQEALRKPQSPEMRPIISAQFQEANKQAQDARSRAEAMIARFSAPLYADLAKRFDLTPEMVAATARKKEAEAMAGLSPRVVAAQAEAEGAKTRAVKGAESESELVEVMRPDGSTAYVQKAKVLAGEKPVTPGAGTPPGEVANNTTPDNLKSLPAASLKMREDIGKDELKMSEDYQRRQVAQSRVNGLLDIMTQYETGKFADTKGEIVGKLRGIGINVKDTDTASPAKFEIFMKGAIKNVFDDLPGGKILLAEISGLSRANANSTMQPEANAKILGDALAAVKYEDKYVLDYAKWRQENPNAYSPMDTIRFNEQWLKNNNLDAYKKETARHIGYIGQNLPAKLDDAVHGQRYYIPQTKELRYFDKTFVNPNGSKGGWAKSDPLAGSAAQ